MPETTDVTEAPAPEAEETPTAPLGDGGKAALDAERKARRAAERATKALEARLADLETATQTEQEKALTAARAEGHTEAMTTANKRLLRAEIRAAAAGKLADPSDALALVDTSAFEIDADGNVDETAIAAAIDALVTAKPYLGTGAVKPQTGSADGGARQSAPAKTLEQQAKDAEAAGDFRLAMSIKNRMLFGLMQANS